MTTSQLHLNRASTARFSAAEIIGQSAISRRLRLQPRHQPEASSIRQVPSQGLGGSSIANAEALAGRGSKAKSLDRVQNLR